MPPSADIASNLAQVRRRIDAAAYRVNRPPGTVTLVAVSKTYAPDVIQAAVAAGQRVFGENRVQEAVAKTEALATLDLEWHLIGHLQSNKARKAIATCSWIHSVDRLDLLQKLDVEAAAMGVRRSVLIQVDLAREATKHGADADALLAIAAAGVDARALDLRGLMIVPPIAENPEDARPWFRRLRDVRDDLVTRGIPAPRMTDLSMGMSHDFEVAIEEGATIVRVGSAIFGARPAPPAG